MLQVRWKSLWCVIDNFLTNHLVKEFWRYVRICRKKHDISKCAVFIGPPCIFIFSVWLEMDRPVAQFCSCAILWLVDKLHRQIQNGYVETRMSRSLASGSIYRDLTVFILPGMPRIWVFWGKDHKYFQDCWAKAC